MLRQLERGSMRRQYLLSLGLTCVVLLLTALLCAGSVVWATVTVRDSAERIVALQTVNRDLLQDLTDAQTGLRGFGISGDDDELVRYESAMYWLAFDRQKLHLLAEGNAALVEAIEEQERAIDRWLQGYAAPRQRGLPRSEAAEDRLFSRGTQLFQSVRSTNQDVKIEVAAVVGDIRGEIRTVMLVALGVVVLLPLLAVIGVVLLIRRMGDSVVHPLTDIGQVLERLRAGDTKARAEVVGPREIRQIAAALNLLTDENMRASEVEADVLNQLETIDRVRTDLVSTVSHELRTPLTSIKGYLELLQDDLAERLSPEQASMMGAVRRNLDRLNELITNLLALSRAEETELNVVPVDLRGIAAEVASDIRLTAAARDIGVRTLQSAAPVIVLGDRSQLIRVVQNLVMNAVKFSRSGGTVEVRVTQEGAQALLEVVDEGIGIPAEDLSGLGSRFYRASNAVRAEIAGTGLGLRIVQTILDRHEGSLSVESVEGEGSTFTVHLPVRSAAFDRPLGEPAGAAPATEPAAGGAAPAAVTGD